MSTSDQSHRAQIIIAIIGLVGVLGGAVIGNWDKIAPWLASSQPAQTTQPPRTVTLERTPDAPAPKADGSADVSVELIRRSVTPRADRSAEPVDTLSDGRIRHLYSVWIEAPPQIMSSIDKVLYQYDHSAFSNPRTESSDRGSGFRDSYTGIGAVNADMDIILVLSNKEQVDLKSTCTRPSSAIELKNHKELRVVNS